MPPHEPDGVTTKSQGAKAAITCSAMARALARSPELNAGCPQQACRGTTTVQPASSSSLTAAKPTEGRMKSTRQVTSSPTRGPAIGISLRANARSGDCGGKAFAVQGEVAPPCGRNPNGRAPAHARRMGAGRHQSTWGAPTGDG